jgi:hypothetical protein
VSEKAHGVSLRNRLCKDFAKYSDPPTQADMPESVGRRRVTAPYYFNKAWENFLGASPGQSGAPIERPKEKKKKKEDLAILSALD